MAAGSPRLASYFASWSTGKVAHSRNARGPR